MPNASTSPIRLTVSRARALAAEIPEGATYHRALEGGVEVDRGHVSASRGGGWAMDTIIDHLTEGRRVELRTGASEGTPRYVLEGIEPRVRASI
jgi:hypothetical protein